LISAKLVIHVMRLIELPSMKNINLLQ